MAPPRELGASIWQVQPLEPLFEQVENPVKAVTTQLTGHWGVLQLFTLLK
jgi:hypothetical protein